MKIITNALSARRPDWKRKRAVKVMPPRKPGDRNPVLRAFIEFDTFGMDGGRMNPQAVGRSSGAWVLAPRSIKSGRYSENNRPRAVAARRDGLSFRIAREVANRREVADRQIKAAGRIQTKHEGNL
jgi:hypothetical protein